MEGRGDALLTVLGVRETEETLVHIRITPTSWKTLSTTFTVPSDVTEVTAKIAGTGNGHLR